MLGLSLLLVGLGADVTWTDRSGQCPDAVAVERAAAALEQGQVAVEVRAARDGLEATLRLETPDGVDVRTLSSPSCETLVEAAALITAASARAQIPAPPPEPELEPTPEPEPEPTPAPEPEPTPEVLTAAAPSAPMAPPESAAQAPMPTVILRGFGFGSFRLTPRFGGGGGLAVGVAGPHWQAEAFGTLSAPSQTLADPAIRVWGWSTGLRGCGLLRRFGDRVPVQPGLCGAFEVGQLRGTAVGAVVARQPHQGVVASLAAGPSLRVFIASRLAVVADLEAVTVLYRPGFEIADHDSFRTAAVSPRVSLGLELRLGPTP